MTTGSAVNGKPAPDPATSGLEGIVAARTPLSEVDGLKGILTIRGYDIEQIASKISLEEAAYLLWHGKLPNQTELDEQNQQARQLPSAARRGQDGRPARREADGADGCAAVRRGLADRRRSGPGRQLARVEPEARRDDRGAGAGHRRDVPAAPRAAAAWSSRAPISAWRRTCSSR